MYSPEIGRFLQRDPIGYYDDTNLYRYVKNNPVNWVDPWGEFAAAVGVATITAPEWLPWVIGGVTAYFTSWYLQQRSGKGKCPPKGSKLTETVEKSSLRHEASRMFGKIPDPKFPNWRFRVALAAFHLMRLFARFFGGQ